MVWRQKLYYDKKVQDILYIEEKTINNIDFALTLTLKYASLSILTLYVFSLIK